DLLYLIKGQNTVYDQLKLLQERYSPTTVDREYRIQKAYETAKIYHARRSNFENWCTAFLIAHNRAKQLDLPKFHGFRPHKDLIRAIKQIDSAYSASITPQILKAETAWNSNRQQPIPDNAKLSTILAEFI
ncbi:hypothetical protein GQ43DRAFT_494938, partial [Delitschia confertaspora ATCC 74209]